MESPNSLQILAEMHKIESIVEKNEQLGKDLVQLVQSLESSFDNESISKEKKSSLINEHQALVRLQSAYNASEQRLEQIKQENYEYRLTLDLLTKARQYDKTAEKTQLEIKNLRQEIAQREEDSRALREEVSNLKQQMAQMTQALTAAVQEEQLRGIANAKRWGAIKEENNQLRALLRQAEETDSAPWPDKPSAG